MVCEYQCSHAGWGTRRKVTPLFTEHKEQIQELATSALPSVNSWNFREFMTKVLKLTSTVRPAYFYWLVLFGFRANSISRPLKLEEFV